MISVWLATGPALPQARTAAGSAQNQFAIALKLLRSGNAREAVGPLLEAARDPTLAVEAHYLLGSAYFQLKDYSRAVEYLEPQRRSARAEVVLYMLVESYRNLKQAEASRQAFTELAARFPQSAWVHKLMGTAYDSQQRPQEAIREFRQALETDPGMPDANFAIGYIYWKQQQYAAAQPWLEKELKLQPCHPAAHFYLGEIARRRQQWSSADAHFRRAASCDSNYASAYIGMATVFEERGKLQEAVNMLREAVRIDPQNWAAHYRLGRLLNRLGRKREAQAEFEKVAQEKAR